MQPDCQLGYSHLEILDESLVDAEIEFDQKKVPQLSQNPVLEQFMALVNKTYLTQDAARIKKCFEILKSPLSEMIEVFDACFASYES